VVTVSTPPSYRPDRGLADSTMRQGVMPWAVAAVFLLRIVAIDHVRRVFADRIGAAVEEVHLVEWRAANSDCSFPRCEWRTRNLAMLLWGDSGRGSDSSFGVSLGNPLGLFPLCQDLRRNLRSKSTRVLGQACSLD